jgi:hypothetical protein
MAASVTIVGTLGQINIAATAAVGVLFPLSAQLDGLMSFALGPLQADLAAQFNAAIAAQATLTLQIGDPFAALQLALAAIGQLQAAIQAALTLPPVNLSISAELTATAALVASLSAKLGLIDALLKVALKIKLQALKFTADLEAALTLPGVALCEFDSANLATAGAEIQALFTAGIPAMGPATAPVQGIIIVGVTSASLTGSLNFLFA